MMRAESKHWGAAPVAWLMAAIVILAWGESLLAWFANDDFLWLDVSHLHSVAVSFSGSAGVVNDFRPVLRLAFWLDWLLFGQQALGWHLINLLVHGAVAFTFARLIAPWLGDRVALPAALLFAASPLLQENVVWISGLSGSLSCLLGLLSLLAFQRYLNSSRVVWLVAACAADLAAMACYEPMMLLPLAHLGMMAAQKRFPRQSLWLFGLHLALMIYRRMVLGGYVSYSYRPISILGLHGLWHDYHPYLKMLHVWPALVIAGTLALLLPRNRDLRLAFVAALAGTAIALLPFAIFTGAASRFFYPAMLGMGLLIALWLHAVTRFLPRWIDLAVLATLGGLLLGREIHHARAETDDWVAAGQLGQQVVAQIAKAEPNPDPNVLHVLLDFPLSVGTGELFFSYPDRAIRRFGRVKFDAAWAGHQIVRLSGDPQMVFLRKLLGQEDQTRITSGQPPLACLDAKLAAAQNPEMFLRGAAATCGLDVLRYSNDTIVHASNDEFFKWYADNKK
jgi:hypothetical protein